MNNDPGKVETDQTLGQKQVEFKPESVFKGVP